MRNRFPSLLIALLAAVPLLHAADSGSAEPVRLSEIGFRAGSGLGSRDDFTQYEIFTAWHIPWTRTHKRNRLTARLEVQAGGGLLRSPEANAAFGYVGPGIRLSGENAPLHLNLGVAPTYLSRRRFGPDDFGHRLQFTSSASLTWMLTSELGLRYRIQHMSNARIGRPNPGLNTHSAGIVLAF